MIRMSLLIGCLLLAGCGKTGDGTNDLGNAPAPKTPALPEAPAPPQTPAPASTPAAPARPLDNKPRILTEPNGPIDPKSVEAAGQVVQHYGALVEQGRFSEAGGLWGNPTAAAAFAKNLKPITHMELGDLGDTEGAAGSIFTTVPVIFYRSGFRRSADIILRRVNDVPGSTAAQRRWHIEQIEWRASG